ncbi:MAG: hypothetical protein M1819_004449 [Sarea resinae]|nr:MAG: hypothetical protein M1819_004449 [Sarea resinae]
MASQAETSNTAGVSTAGGAGAGAGGEQQAQSLSPLEAEVLDEYARVVENLNTLSSKLNALSSAPSAEVLDSLRMLERKTSLVFTLLKASVYSIVLQQQVYVGEEGGGGDEGEAGSGPDDGGHVHGGVEDEDWR